MRIGLLSDTHNYIDHRITSLLSNCDEIWHAGDIGSLSITDTLEKVAPVRAVYGNIDNDIVRRAFPQNLNFTVEGMRIWMTHIGGRPGAYARGISEKFRILKPDIFICGHSHICRVQRDTKNNFLYMNPGAAGVHGFHKVRTMLRFTISSGKIQDLEAIELGTRSSANPVD